MLTHSSTSLHRLRQNGVPRMDLAALEPIDFDDPLHLIGLATGKTET
jgi:hypothetical protein